MICFVCKEKLEEDKVLKQISGPDMGTAMIDRRPHKDIGMECSCCGHEFRVNFYPQMLVVQRVYGTA